MGKLMGACTWARGLQLAVLAFIVVGCTGPRVGSVQPRKGIESVAMQISRELDAIAEDLEKIGSITVSNGTLIQKPEKHFAFDLDLTPRQIFERARVEGASIAIEERATDVRVGVAVNLMNQANRMFATSPQMAEYNAKLAEYQMAVAALQAANEAGSSGGAGGGAGDGTEGETPAAPEDPGEPSQPLKMEPTRGQLPEKNNSLDVLSTSKFPAPLSIRNPDLLNMNLRDLIQLTFDDHTTLKLLEWFSKPSDVGSNYITYACVMNVNCRPGTMTSEGYFGELSVRVSYAMDAMSGTTVPYTQGQPLAFAVFPAMGSQVLDLRMSFREQMATAIKASIADREIGGEGQFDNVNRRVQDSASISTINTVTGFNAAGRHFGWRFAPRFFALADPSDATARSAMRLQMQSFPALVMVQLEKDVLDEKAGGPEGNVGSARAMAKRTSDYHELLDMLTSNTGREFQRLEKKWTAYAAADENARAAILDEMVKEKKKSKLEMAYEEIKKYSDLQAKLDAAMQSKPVRAAWSAVYLDLDELRTLEAKRTRAQETKDESEPSKRTPDLTPAEWATMVRLKARYATFLSSEDEQEKYGALQRVVLQTAKSVAPPLEPDEWCTVGELRTKYEKYLDAVSDADRYLALKEIIADPPKPRPSEACKDDALIGDPAPASNPSGGHGGGAALGDDAKKTKKKASLLLEFERFQHLHKMHLKEPFQIGKVDAVRLEALSGKFPHVPVYWAAKVTPKGQRSEMQAEVYEKFLKDDVVYHLARWPHPLQRHFATEEDEIQRAAGDRIAFASGVRNPTATGITFHPSVRWVRAPNIANSWRRWPHWDFERRQDLRRHPRVSELTMTSWAVRLSRVERMIREFRSEVFCEPEPLFLCEAGCGTQRRAPMDPFWAQKKNSNLTQDFRNDWDPLVQHLLSRKDALRAASIGEDITVQLPDVVKPKTPPKTVFALKSIAPRRGWFGEPSWFVATGLGFTANTKFIVGGREARQVTVSANGKAAVFLAEARSGTRPTKMDVVVFEPGGETKGTAQTQHDAIIFDRRVHPKPPPLSEVVIGWTGTGADRRIGKLEVNGPLKGEEVLRAIFGTDEEGQVKVDVNVDARKNAGDHHHHVPPAPPIPQPKPPARGGGSEPPAKSGK